MVVLPLEIEPGVDDVAVLLEVQALLAEVDLEQACDAEGLEGRLADRQRVDRVALRELGGELFGQAVGGRELTAGYAGGRGAQHRAGVVHDRRGVHRSAVHGGGKRVDQRLDRGRIGRDVGAPASSRVTVSQDAVVAASTGTVRSSPM